MNELVEEKMSIVTSKAQTTRHRIMGIVNGEDFQIVYSDTPGVLDPKYKMQEGMMRFVKSALIDADVILYVVDMTDYKNEETGLVDHLRKMKVPILLLINKMDLAKQEEVVEAMEFWKEELPASEILPISALHHHNTKELLDRILEMLPECPPFFPKDQLSDKPEKFFVSEIIREKIFLNYSKEIPYASEVVVESFKDTEDLLRIRAEIMVERDTQKGIIIGHQGKKLKRVGTEARVDMEKFFGKKIFLELYVKVDKDWRKKENKLKKYGYFD